MMEQTSEMKNLLAELFSQTETQSYEQWVADGKIKHYTIQNEKLEEEVAYLDKRIELFTNDEVLDEMQKEAEANLKQACQLHEMWSKVLRDHHLHTFDYKENKNVWKNRYESLIARFECEKREQENYYLSTNASYKKLVENRTDYKRAMYELKATRSKLAIKQEIFKQHKKYQEKLFYASTVRLAKTVLSYWASQAKMKILQEAKEKNILLKKVFFDMQAKANSTNARQSLSICAKNRKPEFAKVIEDFLDINVGYTGKQEPTCQKLTAPTDISNKQNFEKLEVVTPPVPKSALRKRNQIPELNDTRSKVKVLDVQILPPLEEIMASISKCNRFNSSGANLNTSNLHDVSLTQNRSVKISQSKKNQTQKVEKDFERSVPSGSQPGSRIKETSSGQAEATMPKHLKKSETKFIPSSQESVRSESSRRSKDGGKENLGTQPSGELANVARISKIMKTPKTPTCSKWERMPTNTSLPSSQTKKVNFALPLVKQSEDNELNLDAEKEPLSLTFADDVSNTFDRTEDPPSESVFSTSIIGNNQDMPQQPSSTASGNNQDISQQPSATASTGFLGTTPSKKTQFNFGSTAPRKNLFDLF